MEPAERAGSWTLARLAELPRDGNRYEVIDGNLIVTPPPPPWHQAVGTELLVQLRAQCPPEWLAVYASFVDYGGDGRVPDLVVARRSALRRRGQLAYEPGDVGLVVEIVSPSSRRTDRLAKPAEYADVGIPLFWRVELEPDVVVHPFRLEDGSWVAGEPVNSRGRAVAPWGWVEIDLAELLEQ
jgi:Uma2 family endonuclease